MNISNIKTICGYPSKLIRELMRSFPGLFNISVPAVAAFLHSNNVLEGEAEPTVFIEKAKDLIADLEQNGYITLIHPGEWERSPKGGQLCMATALKPIARAAAQKVVGKVIKNAELINTSSSYLYRVKRIVVFGSFLSDKQFLGDIDIAVDIEQKVAGRHIFDTLCDADAYRAKMDGKAPDDWRLSAWSRNKVMKTLSETSRHISITADIDRGVWENSAHKVIFEDNTPPANDPAVINKLASDNPYLCERLRLAEAIENNGCCVFIYQEANKITNRPLIHTVGLTMKQSHPEIVLFGVSKGEGMKILSALVKQIKQGEKFEPRKRYSDIFPNSTCRFRKVPSKSLIKSLDKIGWFSPNPQLLEVLIDVGPGRGHN
jgi:predicted nucleotidyltransferase